ncbi:MAG: ROK family protein, partial [Clostridia bacterium]
VGAGSNERDFLCLTYGTGVGGAIIQDRAIYTGTNYSAGEFGHIITHGNGVQCTCGQKGCYEQYASTTALVKLVLEKTGENLNGREIFSRLYDGDKIVKAAVKEWLNEIIYGLVTLIHIYNPACIITGGGIMNEDYINDYLNLMIKDNIMPPYRDLVIKKAALGNKAGLLGAAYNALTRVGTQK